MRKKIVCFVLIFTLMLTTAACSLVGSEQNSGLTRYQAGFFDTFDTYIQIIIYAEDRETFDAHFNAAREAFRYYHMLFDIFSAHDGVNNIYTINAEAGIAPVLVDAAIIELLILSQAAYFDTDGVLDITLGPVLSVWRRYRQAAISHPEYASLPDIETLTAASELRGIHHLHIDPVAQSVFLEHRGMQLDVGATAKSFAASRVATLLYERGVRAAVINAGGDVIVMGKSQTAGGRPWNIGVQHPSGAGLIDSVLVENKAVSTSGGDKRQFLVDDISYHHIINPATLMPASGFLSVTVAHEDAMVAEILSTALFILPFERGYNLAKQAGAAVLWVFEDASVAHNEYYRNISQNFS